MAEKSTRDSTPSKNEDLDRDRTVQQGKDPKDLGSGADSGEPDDEDDEDEEDDELEEK